jgi:translation initiation factor 4G
MAPRSKARKKKTKAELEVERLAREEAERKAKEEEEQRLVEEQKRKEEEASAHVHHCARISADSAHYS